MIENYPIHVIPLTAKLLPLAEKFDSGHLLYIAKKTYDYKCTSLYLCIEEDI